MSQVSLKYSLITITSRREEYGVSRSIEISRLTLCHCYWSKREKEGEEQGIYITVCPWGGFGKTRFLLYV
jgi:hypothetical protein